MPLMEGLQVIHSKIHGYGVKATRRFCEGDIILYGDGILYHEDDEWDDEYSLIVPREDEDGEELPSLYWDLACQSRWINHSCDPNTEVDTEWDAERQTVIAWWTALRDIEPGEELSYDYAFAGHLAMPCACGAATCRGLIVDPEPEELARIPEDLRPLLRMPPPRPGRTRAAAG